MDDMEVKSLLLGGPKTYVLERLQREPALIDPLIQTSLTAGHPLAWRAAWALSSVMETNDDRLQPYLDSYLSILPSGHSGLDREILKVLLKMDLPESCRGSLFDLCSGLWERLTLQSSVRYIAFRMLLKIAGDYQDFKDELMYLGDPIFTDSLSPGVRRSVIKALHGFRKENGIDRNHY